MDHKYMANTGTTIEYQQSFVAFLDILGFRKMVIDSQNNQEILKILVDSLSICGAFPSGAKEATGSSGQRRAISIQSRFFSDTLVFFLQEKPEDIAQLFLMIRYLQDRLWEKGLCLRGAITLGGMYWEDSKDLNITVGPGLIEAHKLESEIAIYPRIIVSEELYTYINNKNIKADPFGGGLRAQKPDALLKDYIKQDADGVHFLDLLNSEILRTNDEVLESLTDGKFSITWNFLSESNHEYMLIKVDDIITENLTSENKKIRQKHEWLKSYVNKYK
jgi:hypothetical protein